MIRLDDVAKIYRRWTRRVSALDGVSLNVEPGEFVSIEGPSGSGKTTLLFVAAGMVRPSSGSVVVDGWDYGQVSRASLPGFRLRTFGFVFQMFHLVPYLTALDNVMVPIRLLGLQKRGAGRRQANELLERFGLSDRAGHYPSELSAGERQRVAVARAMANRPRILFADEPTGNLDSASADAVFNALDEIHRDGTTLLVVTHDVRAAGKAGRTLKLEDGRLKTEG